MTTSIRPRTASMICCSLQVEGMGEQVPEFLEEQHHIDDPGR